MYCDCVRLTKMAKINENWIPNATITPAAVIITTVDH